MEASRPNPELRGTRRSESPSGAFDWLYSWKASPLFYLVVLWLLTLAAYHNSFGGAFVFDDHRVIRNHPGIHSFWPEGAFTTGSRRVLGHFSFVLNYKLGQEQVWGYHAFNLTIHLIAGSLLFGLIRRTWLRYSQRQTQLTRKSDQTITRFAFLVTAIWLVHPLQTESVTYIVQRLESMAGMFYLALLYCVLRGAQSPDTWASRLWYLAGITCCWAGMTTKEVMISAPFALAAYDRLFLADRWRDIGRQRGWVYGGCLLALCWLGYWMMPAFDPSHESTLGLGLQSVSPSAYLLSQPAVLLHYLKLTFWPAELCFDYKWPVEDSFLRMLVPGLLWVILLGASVILLVKKHPAGWLGTSFFLILAPSSSVMPIQDLAVEHRMYLALAPVLVGAGLVVSRTIQMAREHTRVSPLVLHLLGAVLLGALIARTMTRNEDYASRIALWTTVVRQVPENYRAHYNLGKALLNEGDHERALTHFQEALRIDVSHWDIFVACGETLVRMNRTEDAIEVFERGLLLHPASVVLRHNLAVCLVTMGLIERAAEECLTVLDKDPQAAVTYNQLALIRLQQGRLHQAVARLQRAVAIEPENSEFWFNLAAAEASQGDLESARAHYRRSVQIRPDYPEAHINLGALLETNGRRSEAVRHYRLALHSDSNSTVARLNLARLLAIRGDLDLAEHEFRQVLQQQPDSLVARQGLQKVQRMAAETRGSSQRY